ncbi:hypothetical protein DEA98_28625 (plasmid) [Brucella pseudogrignonensis]|nr:hypothetical protein [Brucella pseudogrignonensis]
MINESTGQYHSYSNKPAVIHSEFAIPEGSPKWVRELSRLPGDQPSQNSGRRSSIIIPVSIRG